MEVGLHFLFCLIAKIIYLIGFNFNYFIIVIAIIISIIIVIAIRIIIIIISIAIAIIIAIAWIEDLFMKQEIYLEETFMWQENL